MAKGTHATAAMWMHEDNSRELVFHLILWNPGIKPRPLDLHVSTFSPKPFPQSITFFSTLHLTPGTVLLIVVSAMPQE